MLLFMFQIAVSHDGQIQYLPISTEQQIVSPEELEAAAHSAVTGWFSHLTDHAYYRLPKYCTYVGVL